MTEGSDFEIALTEALAELERSAIPHMLIGGLALVAWGLPRATLDIDFTLWVTADGMTEVCQRLAARFTARVPDPWGFVRRTRVLPVIGPAEVRMDFIFAAFPFEKIMLDRATSRMLGRVPVKVASLEDLILLKVGSSRQRDREDVRMIATTHHSEIDWDYVISVGGMIADATEQPEVLSLLQSFRSKGRTQ